MRLTPVLILATVLSLALSVSGKTIVVPKDAPGIQAGLDKADSGDTVFVKKGLYRETVTLKDNVFLIGESSSLTRIQGNKKDPVVTGADQATIKNFVIENGGTGIKCENTSPVIENCIIRDNKGTGIQCLVSLPYIRNCIIYRNGWSGIFCESSRSIKTAIEHNIIAENGYSGIMLSARSEVLVSHNILFNNKEYGVWAGEESRRSRIVFNDFFGNRLPNNYYVQIDNTNISADPLFMMADNQTYNYGQSEALKGKGKDGLSIGLISEVDMEIKINDPDQDGIESKKDACPDIAEDLDGFEDQDGCPDFDNDKDGIYDSEDKCPDQAEDMDGFRDDDGCPDDDNDKDGILDKDDICPHEKEIVNGYKDEDGCPDEVPVKKE